MSIKIGNGNTINKSKIVEDNSRSKENNTSKILIGIIITVVGGIILIFVGKVL